MSSEKDTLPSHRQVTSPFPANPATEALSILPSVNASNSPVGVMLDNSSSVYSRNQGTEVPSNQGPSATVYSNNSPIDVLPARPSSAFSYNPPSDIQRDRPPSYSNAPLISLLAASYSSNLSSNALSSGYPNNPREDMLKDQVPSTYINNPPDVLKDHFSSIYSPEELTNKVNTAFSYNPPSIPLPDQISGRYPDQFSSYSGKVNTTENSSIELQQAINLSAPKMTAMTQHHPADFRFDQDSHNKVRHILTHDSGHSDVHHPSPRHDNLPWRGPVHYSDVSSSSSDTRSVYSVNQNASNNSLKYKVFPDMHGNEIQRYLPWTDNTVGHHQVEQANTDMLPIRDQQTEPKDLSVPVLSPALSTAKPVSHKEIILSTVPRVSHPVEIGMHRIHSLENRSLTQNPVLSNIKQSLGTPIGHSSPEMNWNVDMDLQYNPVKTMPLNYRQPQDLRNDMAISRGERSREPESMGGDLPLKYPQNQRDTTSNLMAMTKKSSDLHDLPASLETSPEDDSLQRIINTTLDDSGERDEAEQLTQGPTEPIITSNLQKDLEPQSLQVNRQPGTEENSQTFKETCSTENEQETEPLSTESVTSATGAELNDVNVKTPEPTENIPQSERNSPQGENIPAIHNYVLKETSTENEKKGCENCEDDRVPSTGTILEDSQTLPATVENIIQVETREEIIPNAVTSSEGPEKTTINDSLDKGSNDVTSDSSNVVKKEAKPDAPVRREITHIIIVPERVESTQKIIVQDSSILTTSKSKSSVQAKKPLIVPIIPLKEKSPVGKNKSTNTNQDASDPSCDDQESDGSVTQNKPQVPQPEPRKRSRKVTPIRKIIISSEEKPNSDEKDSVEPGKEQEKNPEDNSPAVSVPSSLLRKVYKEPKEKPFICDQCNRGFSHAGDYKSHVKSHTSGMPFVCGVCNVGFRKSGHLLNHSRRHTGEKPFICDCCDKSFGQLGTLKRHMRIHTGEKPYTCPECNKNFSQQSYMKVHLRLHSGERPYKCEFCEHNFLQAGDLKKHLLRMHTENKKIKCPHCPKCFGDQVDFRRHVRTHEGKLTCKKCHKSFDRVEDMKIHKQLFHSKGTPKELPHMCDLCDIGFKLKGDLRSHIKTCHPQDMKKKTAKGKAKRKKRGKKKKTEKYSDDSDFIVGEDVSKGTDDKEQKIDVNTEQDISKKEEIALTRGSRKRKARTVSLQKLLSRTKRQKQDNDV